MVRILQGTVSVDGNGGPDFYNFFTTFYKTFTTFFWEIVSESAIIPRMMRTQGRSARNGRADRSKAKEERNGKEERQHAGIGA